MTEISKSRKNLLFSKRFLPLFFAQFLGAFNDYLFRSSMILILGFNAGSTLASSSLINNVISILFVLPFIIFSPIAGQLADKLVKSKMVQKNKLLEMGISVFALCALYSQQSSLLITALILFSIQSAMFTPNKYALLPQLLDGENLIRANAWVASGTMSAFALGIISAVILVPLENHWLTIGLLSLLIATLGYLCARTIPMTKPGKSILKIDWNPVKHYNLIANLAMRNRELWGCMMAIAWFWSMAISFIVQLPSAAQFNFALEEVGVAALLLSLVMGMTAGSSLASLPSKCNPETGLIPSGLIFVSCLLWQWLELFDSPTNPPNWLLHVIYIFAIGFFLSTSAIPALTMLQIKTRLGNRARIIALSNSLTAVAVIFASLFAILSISVLAWSMSNYFSALAIINLVAALYFVAVFRKGFLKVWAKMISLLLYRVRDADIRKLPKHGSALLICNHVAYVDPIIIFAASDRNIRFLMDKDIMETLVLNTIFKSVGAIPLCSPLQNRRAYEDAMNAAVNSLRNGELLLIFPEGQLTRTGEIGNFKRGLEKILESYPVPVIPMSIGGLWGSFFSHKKGKAARKKPRVRLFRRVVNLKVGDFWEPEIAKAAPLYHQISEMRGNNR